MTDAVQLTKQLAEIARENELAELDFQEGDTRIHIVLESEQSAPAVAQPIMLSPSEMMAPTPAPVAAPPSSAVASAPAGETIDSPLPGVFYRASRPGAPSFVEEGQQVAPQQTLCIVEAMKLMNEISAEKPCRILKILVKNGDPVEEGQPLFLIES